MTSVRIAHALLRWTDAKGRRRIAHHGQRVDLPDDLVARYRPLGVFAEADTSTAEIPQSETGDDVARPVLTDPPIPAATVLPDRPRQVEPKAVWETYAAEVHGLTDGRLGVPADTAAALDKRALIATTYPNERPNDA